VKAAVWNDAGSLDVVDRPQPDPKPGWVRLRVGSVGLCGTDLHFFRGAFPSPAGLLPGHEVGGVVDAPGEGAHLAPGATVAVEPLVGCGRCQHCAVGQYNRCAERRIFGISGRGGLAEYATVPASRAHPVPAGLTAEDAALAEPLAVCVRGVRLAGVGLGSRVAVLGAGTIGLMSVLAARAAGAAQVQVSARHPFQREMAQALGAAPMDEGDFDCVLETVGGQADTLTEAVGLARPGGTIGVLGVFEGVAPLPAFELSMKELHLVGSNCYARAESRSEFDIALALLASHRDPLRALVTHRFPLGQVNDAFAAAADKSTGAIKVHVQP
jgi:threonine dehydrogenase-like Zn-dependent dehydrogenase